MSEERVSYRREGDVALVTLDDGKVNAMSPSMIAAVRAALERAEADGGPLVLAGRPGVFCGGFDLKVMRAAGLDTLRMLRAGFLLCARLLEHPTPVVIACTGHAIALGSFLLLSGDALFAAAGEFEVRANEVAIGLTLPRAAVAICRQRLAPAHLQRATLLAESYTPQGAAAAGFLDWVVEPDVVVARALEHAQALAGLDMEAHRRTKERLRAADLRALKRGLAADMRELTLLGARKLLTRSAPKPARS
jgi:enoyl-CoA hydratase